MSRIYFFHGKDSTPNGYKANYLRTLYPDLVAPQLTNDLHERLTNHERIIEDDAILVGSSLGGLSALMFVQQAAHRVRGLVLIAPAVGFYPEQYRVPELLELVTGLIIPATLPAHIIAGLRDEVIPVQAIRDLVQRSPTPEHIVLTELDEDHFLRSDASMQATVAGIEAIRKR